MYQITSEIAPYRARIDAYIKEHWSGPLIVTLGNRYDSSDLPGFAAVVDGALWGAPLYRPLDGECEVAALFSLHEGQGVGRALLNAVIAQARGQGLRRVWLVTTNDNIRGIRFYQMYGFQLKAVHIGSFAEVKRLKQIQSDIGEHGIKIAHEFEFVYEL